MQVLESLVGQEVSIICLDREESETDGELLEVDLIGATVKYTQYGNEFCQFIPMSNINSITHKILGK